MTDLTERCDRCGAAAKSRWELKTGELFFCEHHTREYVSGLAQVAMLLASDKEKAAV